MATFRDFELYPEERRLIVRGETVQIGARALDLLIALIEHGDRVVSKRELLDIVWPNLIVEENNIQVQIHALRKLLGPMAIATVPGCGYRFTAEAACGNGAARPRDKASNDNVATNTTERLEADGNMPAHVSELFGRATELEAVHALLASERLVTITGASGIGKTRLAQAAAHALGGQYPQGVWMVELAAVHAEDQVVHAVSQALAIPLAGRKAALDELLGALRHKSMLLVLDNCEHMVGATGILAARLLADAPQVRLLVTSQELLHVADEVVYKLAPLSIPREINLDTALGYGAIELFVERSHALDRTFELNRHNVAFVVDICRKLDGIPLAIEFAAARVPNLGVYAVQQRLDERFRLLTGGARVSLRRHQTLRAALDWSHNLLSDDERRVFRQLAVFSDGFSLEGAQLLCCDENLDQWNFLEVLNALVDKSLVLVDADLRPRYRILESTRAYAMEKIAEVGETNALLRRHAEVVKELCLTAIRSRDVESILIEMNNVRIAYAWAIGANGDSMIAVSLATASAMVLSVSGFVCEAMQRLLEVEPLVSPSTPPKLAAQFWQWLGRIGVEGRLPTSRCLEALERSKVLFASLGNQRHVHACLRMRAEAMLTNQDFDGAERELREAELMEPAGLPVADQMRRLRVKGKLHAAAERHAESLAISASALHLAEMAGMERYQLIVLSDMAGVHLRMGNFEEAVDRFSALIARIRSHQSHGLVLAQSMGGLTAALVASRRIDEAMKVCRDSTPHLIRSGLLLAQCDIYAWLFAIRGCTAISARLVGAADAFHASSEIARDSVKRMARVEVMQVLQVAYVADQIKAWLREGEALDEHSIARLFNG